MKQISFILCLSFFLFLFCSFVVCGNVMNSLSDEKTKEFKDFYEKQIEGVVCDICNSSEHVIPVVNGKPDQNLILYAQQGHVKLGSCTERQCGYCTSCDNYISCKE